MSISWYTLLLIVFVEEGLFIDPIKFYFELVIKSSLLL